jgi:hypothetical protein
MYPSKHEEILCACFFVACRRGLVLFPLERGNGQLFSLFERKKVAKKKQTTRRLTGCRVWELRQPKPAHSSQMPARAQTIRSAKEISPFW